MAISAFTPRRAYATAGIIALFVIPGIVAAVVVGLGLVDDRDLADRWSARTRSSTGRTRPVRHRRSARSSSSSTCPDIAYFAAARGRHRRLVAICDPPLPADRRRDASPTFAAAAVGRRARRRPPTAADRPRRASRAGTATSSPSTTSRSRSAPGSPACSARTAPARRRSCTCSPGLLRPSSGRVLIAGQPAWRNPSVYRSIGLVPEREAVHPFLTGREFVELAARLQRLPDPAAAAARGDRDRRPRGGRRPADRRPTRRACASGSKIAAALVHDPPILLLDEPFNGMDPRQRLHMMDLLRSMAGRRPDDPVLVAHPRGGRAARRRRPRHRRRPARRGRRLPRDPAADDRPAAHVPSSARRTIAGSPRRSWPSRRSSATELRDGPPHGPGRRSSPASPGPSPGSPATRRCRCTRSPRPTTRSRASSPTWCRADDDLLRRSPTVTLRALLGRRRTLLMLLLAGDAGPPRAPRPGQRRRAPAETLGPTIDGFVVRIVLPLIALVFGTAALGSELEDGTGDPPPDEADPALDDRRRQDRSSPGR